MPGRICYLGDDDLGGAAAYLAGVMAHFGIAFDHVPSPQSPGDAFARTQYAAYVLSDYPAARWNTGQLERVVQDVRAGSGFLMLGGWESFHGQKGEYHRSRLAEVLPVVMAAADDRRNCAQPCLVDCRAEHPIVDGLPWDTPPTIGGYNAFLPKPGAKLLLAGVRFAVARQANEFRFTRGEEVPLLVVGEYGRGRTAALATDVAPHWVGGWVDWGDGRVCQPIGSGSIEVGNWYARFFRNLVAWLINEQ
jgi:hypothetical protein